MMKWIVFVLDVWGNEEDGFEINDKFSAGVIEVEDDKEETLFNKLKEKGYFKETTKFEDVEFECWSFEDDWWGIANAETGEPLYELSRIKAK